MKTAFVFFCAMALALAACGATPAATDPTPALPTTQAATPGTPPEAPTEPSTASPEPEASPTPTHAPSPSPVPTRAAACFVTSFAPVGFMPDGQRIVLRGEQGVQVFNLQTMQAERLIEAPTPLHTPAVAVSPDGATLAWALADYSIQLVRIVDQQVLHTLTGHTALVGKLRFTPSGDRLISASHDGWVRVWDMNGNLAHEFQPVAPGGSANEVLGLGISPDGTTLATLPFDGPVILWSLDDYRLVRALGGYGGYDTSDVAFSPDGRLVAADLGNGLHLWRAADGSELLGGNPGINSLAVAFSPDGRYLTYAEIGETYDIVFSSPDGAQRLRKLEGSPAVVWELIFSPDGARLMSADGVEVRIWRVETGELEAVGRGECGG